MSLYAVTLSFPFTGTKRPSPNHNSTRPLFLLHQTLQLALCIRVGSVLLASPKPSRPLDCQMLKRDSLLQRMGVQWWRALHHSSRLLALRMVILGLCVAARPWMPISWHSRRTVAVVAPRCFHFTITSLTVDRGSSSRTEI